MPTEILFIIEDAPEGCFIARAATASIFTEADTLAQLRDNLREAVACHFDEVQQPGLIRLCDGKATRPGLERKVVLERLFG